MSILDILNTYWKQGILYLLLGAGLIQISPIKIDPFSWLAKKIGNALNVDILKQLEETRKSLDILDEKLTTHIKENEEESINECRRRILVFNEKVLANDNVTKERYDSILEDIDEYEDYCENHKGYQNSKAVLSIQNLKHDYLQRYQP